EAVERVCEGLARHPGDLELKYLLALAFARVGNIAQAKSYLDELLAVQDLEPKLRVEVLSLEGRYYKDRYARSKDPAARAAFARTSAECYLRAYKVAGDFFPLINAATMSLLAGKRQKALALAREAAQQARQELRGPERKKDYWLLATLAEALFTLGELKEASARILEAVKLAKKNVGDIGAMRRNFLLLKEKVRVSEEIWECFKVGSVVIFSGHMLDHPRRQAGRYGTASRFPADPVLLRRVSEDIAEKLEDLNATVGYCSAACGSDILFAERMLERMLKQRGGELHVVLPFDRGDFYYTSVDYGLDSMASWRRRCDLVLDRARVHYATTEHYLGDDTLFEFTNTFTQGLALTRAAERGVDAHARVVLDPGSPLLVGGTAYSLDRWKLAARKFDPIDLEKLRANTAAPPTLPEGKPGPAPATVKGGQVKRQVKVMLFADVKGFSGLA